MPSALLTWRPTDVEREIIQKTWPKEVTVVEDRDGDLSQVGFAVGGISLGLLERMPKLRMVHTLGHGVDFLNNADLLEALRNRNVAVAKANPAAKNIAEFVIMCMVALSRRLLPMHEALAYRGDWSDARKATRMQGGLGGELFGSTLGIVSFGSIGQEVYHRAKAFGMEINALVKRPERLDRDAFDLAWVGGADQLDDLLARSRYVVLSLPLTPETRGMMNAERFATMQEGSYLVNISRGPVVCEQALFDALASGKLAGAALDVWSIEEERGVERRYPTPYPLHTYNVIMTPHYSGATYESRKRAITKAGENIRRCLAGEPLLDVADLSLGF